MVRKYLATTIGECEVSSLTEDPDNTQPQSINVANEIFHKQNQKFISYDAQREAAAGMIASGTDVNPFVALTNLSHKTYNHTSSMEPQP
jgi:hypothetical protein